MTTHRTRRDMLRAIGTAGAVTLAGCTGGNGDGQTDGGGGGGDEGEPEATESVDADEVVTVGPNGDLVFEPAELAVEVGTTVAWKWDSGGHTVTVNDQPQGSQWRGTNLSTKESGYVLTKTFDVAGRYDYYCTPHRSSGMKGTVVVGETPTEAEATGGGATTVSGSGESTPTDDGAATESGENTTTPTDESTPQQY